MPGMDKQASVGATDPGKLMKAIVQDRYGPPDVLELREIERPALADDGVLVRVRAASVNAYDWHMMRGEPLLARMMMGRRPDPKVLGRNLSGQVEAVGKSVTRFQPGDEVFGSGSGTFAEYATAPEHSLTLKPPRLTFEQAAAISTAGLTALQGLRDHANLQAGQKVLVYGAGGGVGTFAVQIAKALGAHVTAASRAANFDLLRSIGADEVLDYSTEDFARGTPRYDVFFDIGGTRSFRACRHVLTPKGTLVVVGGPSGRWVSPVGRLLKARMIDPFVSQRLVTFLPDITEQDLGVLKGLIEDGRLSPVIDRVYPLRDAAEAIRYAETGHARGKVVIQVSEGAT